VDILRKKGYKLQGVAQCEKVMERGLMLTPPVETSVTMGVLELPKKLMLIRLRWLVVIVCSYLLLYSRGEFVVPATAYSFILLYILSNIALYLIDERLFDSSYFYGPLVLCDTFCITASLMISGQIGSDFYLVYLLLIILCAVLQDFRGLIVVVVLITLGYGYLFFTGAENNDPSAYLRLPFLFVVSLFYGYFAQIGRAEKFMKQEAERRTFIAEQIADTERLKFEFLANTTHELRTPLTTIMGYGDLLMDGSFGPLMQDQVKAIGRLVESARGLLSLVEQILDYPKLQRGETGLSVKRQDLAPLLDEIRREIAQLEKRKPYRVQYEVEDGILAIETDWGKLKNILTNILSNAIKFTDQGKVELSIRNGSKAEVSFTVSDTGIGIPKDKIPLIFDMFRQLDGSQTRRYGGTGLGLSISKNLAALIGGRLEVESEVGKGSTFTLTIPVSSL